jgi:hypothetical protein
VRSLPADVTVGELPQPEGVVSAGGAGGSSRSASDSDVASPTIGAASHAPWQQAGGAAASAAAAGGAAAEAELEAREEAHEQEMARKALRWDLVVLDLSCAWADSSRTKQPQEEQGAGVAARAR